MLSHERYTERSELRIKDENGSKIKREGSLKGEFLQQKEASHETK